MIANIDIVSIGQLNAWPPLYATAVMQVIAVETCVRPWSTQYRPPMQTTIVAECERQIFKASALLCRYIGLPTAALSPHSKQTNAEYLTFRVILYRRCGRQQRVAVYYRSCHSVCEVQSWPQFTSPCPTIAKGRRMQ